MNRREITQFLVDQAAGPGEFMAYKDYGDSGTVAIAHNGMKFKYSNAQLETAAAEIRIKPQVSPKVSPEASKPASKPAAEKTPARKPTTKRTTKRQTTTRKRTTKKPRDSSPETKAS
jgi:hypothetical protein